jgi:hypothetical protein
VFINSFHIYFGGGVGGVAGAVVEISRNDKKESKS